MNRRSFFQALTGAVAAIGALWARPRFEIDSRLAYDVGPLDNLLTVHNLRTTAGSDWQASVMPPLSLEELSLLVRNFERRFAIEPPRVYVTQEEWDMLTETLTRANPELTDTPGHFSRLQFEHTEVIKVELDRPFMRFDAELL